MQIPVPREMVTGYVRRFGGWTPLREAVASVLGINADDVRDLDAGGAPPVYIQARTQHGDFAIYMELFVDTSRVKAWRGKMALLMELARSLSEDILCDDGLSPNPYRWVLIRPDGSRFEVFEATGQDQHMLVLDRELEPRRIYDDAFFESRAGLPRDERSQEELEWELRQGSLKLYIALDMGQDLGPQGFAWYAEWEAELKAEIERRKSKRR